MKCDDYDKFADSVLSYTPTPEGVYFTPEYAQCLERLFLAETGRLFTVHLVHRTLNDIGFTDIQILAPNTAIYSFSVLDSVCQQMSKKEFSDTLVDLTWRTYKNDIYRQSTEL